jgi:predicted transcriptional regulator
MLEGVEQHHDLDRLLRHIPDKRVRWALRMRVEIGLPVEDQEHPERSISGILGVTPRTIRNYFQAASRVLAEAKEVR